MNLATRPFYNDRGVHLILAGICLAAAIALGSGAGRLVDLSRTKRALTAQAEAAEREAAAVLARAAGHERDASGEALASLDGAAREVGRLIERRLFSWSAFLHVIERTLPPAVMLTAVRPEADERGTFVNLEVIGRTLADIEDFIRRLERSGAFADVLARQGELQDDGRYRARLRGRLLRLDAPASDRQAGDP